MSTALQPDIARAAGQLGREADVAGTGEAMFASQPDQHDGKTIDKAATWRPLTALQLPL
jgi:hypothetical protein